MISMVVNLKKGGGKKEKKVQQQLDMYVRIGRWVQLIRSAGLPRSEEGRGHSTHGNEKRKKEKKKTIIHFAFRLGGISMLLQGTLKRKGQNPPEMPLFLACFMPKDRRSCAFCLNF